MQSKACSSTTLEPAQTPSLTVRLRTASVHGLHPNSFTTVRAYFANRTIFIPRPRKGMNKSSTGTYAFHNPQPPQHLGPYACCTRATCQSLFWTHVDALLSLRIAQHVRLVTRTLNESAAAQVLSLSCASRTILFVSSSVIWNHTQVVKQRRTGMFWKRKKVKEPGRQLIR